MSGDRPLGRASERICFVVAAFALLGAIRAFRSGGFSEDGLVGLATAAAFAVAGGFLRHQRKVAEFNRGHPGWSEMGHVKRRRK